MIASKQEGSGPARDESGKFLPGVSGNPSGRPKTKFLTDALRRKMERMGPEELDALMDSLFAQVSSGDKSAAATLKQLWDRLEGPVVQQLEASHDISTLVVARGSGHEDAPELPSRQLLGLDDPEEEGESN